MNWTSLGLKMPAGQQGVVCSETLMTRWHKWIFSTISSITIVSGWVYLLSIEPLGNYITQRWEGCLGEGQPVKAPFRNRSFAAVDNSGTRLYLKITTTDTYTLNPPFGCGSLCRIPLPEAWKTKTNSIWNILKVILCSNPIMLEASKTYISW